MKRFIAFCVLALMPILAFSQEVERDGFGNARVNAWNFKTITTFTASSDDTTGYIAIGSFPDILASREVAIIAVSTDTIAVDIHFIGRNRSLTSITETYSDSLVLSTGATSNRIVLKDATLNRLEGLDEFKVGSVFRASGQGTLTGRTYKLYLKVVR